MPSSTPLDPDLLLTLLAVARRGSISAAARELDLSQPAVTARVRRLEDAVRGAGDEVPIEQRASEEVRGEHAADVAVANPAFDVTPARLVSGLITEHGIFEASEEGLKKLKTGQALN